MSPPWWFRGSNKHSLRLQRGGWVPARWYFRPRLEQLEERWVLSTINMLSVNPTSIHEGAFADIVATFTDPTLTDTHSVTVAWGDANDSAHSTFSLEAATDLTPGETFASATDAATLTIDAVNTTTGEITFTVSSHTYADDGLAPGNALPSDDATITLTIKDADEEETSAFTTLPIANQAPTSIVLSATSVNENGTVTLTGSFHDDGTLDTHSIVIDWNSLANVGGAGEGTTTITTAGPNPANTTLTYLGGGNWSFSAQHQYLDDNPTGSASDSYTIKATITDDDTGSEFATTTTTITNQAPTLTDVAATPIFENGTTTLSGTIADVGTLDTFKVEIDWDGDGSYEETHTNVAAGAFSYTHQFLDDTGTGPVNNLPINVKVTDDDTDSVTAGTTVQVTNVAPTSIVLSVNSVNENGTVTLTGSFHDDGTLDTHSIVIDWNSLANVGGAGEGTTTITTAGPNPANTTLTYLGGGNWSFSAQHQYLDDNPTGDPSNSYTIKATITDDDTGTASATTTTTITNVAPTVSLNAVTAIDENGIATLNGVITDVGTLDTFTLNVNWGDTLSPPNTQSFSLGTTTLTKAINGIDWNPATRQFSIDHRYLDDNPSNSASDTYTISVQATDDDTGNSDADAGTLGNQPTTRQVVVTNLKPTVSLNSVSPINENGIANLSGAITDVGTLDTFTLVVNWGDSLSPQNNQTFTLGTSTLTKATNGIDWNPATRQFSIDHRYLDDNPTNTAVDTYTISVQATDDDTGVSDANSGTLGNQATTTPVIVRNVAPSIVTLSVSPQSILENGTTVLTGTVADEGSLDRHTVRIFWGDGNSEQVNVNPITRMFSVEHRYLNNQSGNVPYTIFVQATDDDTGISDADRNVSNGQQFDSIMLGVTNVGPSGIRLEPNVTIINQNADLTLTISFTDPGSLDSHTVVINWGDTPIDAAPIQLSAGVGVLQVTHRYSNDSPVAQTSATGGLSVIGVNVKITVTVYDNDDGSAAQETQDILLIATPTITANPGPNVSDSSFTAEGDRLDTITSQSIVLVLANAAVGGSDGEGTTTPVTTGVTPAAFLGDSLDGLRQKILTAGEAQRSSGFSFAPGTDLMLPSQAPPAKASLLNESLNLSGDDPRILELIENRGPTKEAVPQPPGMGVVLPPLLINPEIAQESGIWQNLFDLTALFSGAALALAYASSLRARVSALQEQERDHA